MEYISEIHKLLRIGISTEGEVSGLILPVLPESQPRLAETVKVKKLFGSGIVVYPAVFVAAFLVFYGILNFPALVSQVSGWFIKPQNQQILGDNLSAYYQWISGYYFYVSDSSLLDPNNDIDHDGLSNYDEFIMRTNPVVADSNGDGILDGVKVLDSMNPWGQGPMTDTQKKLAAGLDLNLINNRLAFYSSASVKSSSGDVLGAAKINYDQSRSGTLSIPKLKLQVPIIWSKDPSNFDTDLTHGVVHYPGTAMPGEVGTVYISGHSSDYLWKTSPYRSVFARLNLLDIGDDIFVDIYGADGKLYNYRYQVSVKNTYTPVDQTQFAEDGTAKLNLSTCWPIGTQNSRYVVSAVLQGL